MNIKIKNTPRIRVTLIIIALFYAGMNFYHHNWTKENRVIEWDVVSYYAYLPATFIHGDLSLDFVDEPGFVNDNKFWFDKTPIGKKIIVTSMGMSYMYAPFFFLGHASAYITGKKTNGFTGPYKFFLVWGTLIYLLWGIYFLYKLLLEYFSPRITQLSVFTIAFGTNLLYYSTFESTVSHSYSFSLISLFLYLTHRWYKSPSYKKIITLGFVFGLITLIRPTNTLILIVFLLWGVNSFKSFYDRIQFYLKRFDFVIIMIIPFFLVWIPQFLYWKMVSGQYLFNSYGSHGYSFFFTSPHILDFLFSFRKGWYIYTPIMIIATLGLINLYKKNRGLFIPIIIYLPIMIHITASWWSWWYGGSFGCRTFVETYGIMVLPLAALYQKIASLSKTIVIYLFTSVCSLLVAFNLFQTEQYLNQAIHFVGMNKNAYFETFLKLKPTKNYWNLLTIPDYQLARKGIYIFRQKGDRTSENKNLADYFDDIKNNRTEFEIFKKKSEESNISIDSLIYLEAQRRFSLKQKQ